MDRLVDRLIHLVVAVALAGAVTVLVVQIANAVRTLASGGA